MNVSLGYEAFEVFTDTDESIIGATPLEFEGRRVGPTAGGDPVGKVHPQQGSGEMIINARICGGRFYP